MNVSKEIFRAYDIRGVVDKTLTEAGVYDIGLAIGSMIQNVGERQCIVGRDGRLSGPRLMGALQKGLLDSGCDVIDIGPVPSPMMYFATQYLDIPSGVVLTGSHNPANYNGLKIIVGGTALYGASITALYRLIEVDNLRKGRGSYTEREIVGPYVERVVKEAVLARPLKVVVDAGNGVTGAVVPLLYEALGCEVIPLYCEVDGNFPNHHPDPSKPENLSELIATVKHEQADIGLAFDGDGDRLGVVDNNGKMIWPDRLLILFAEDLLTRHPGAKVIYDVKCSRHVHRVVEDLGGRPLMWKTGHSLVKAKMRETGALLAGEMSGHLFMGETWYGFDDGVYTGAKLLQLLSRTTDNSAQLFAHIPESITTPELDIPIADDEKFELIEKLVAAFQLDGVRVSTIDGLRVDFADGWGLVRASNTTPKLVARFEADDEERMVFIQQVFKELFKKVAPDVKLSF